MLDLLRDALNAGKSVGRPVERLANKILEELRSDPESEKLKVDIRAIVQEEMSSLKKPRPEKRAEARMILLEERQRELRGKQRASLTNLSESLQNVTSAYNSTMSVELEKAINAFCYSDFGSFEANRTAAKQIQQLVKRVGFRFKDPKSGRPANLICKESTSDANGRFYFEYCEDGKKKTGASFSKLPYLEVVPSSEEEILISSFETLQNGMLFDHAA